jgi:O-6-methylguanine DNA methyltransferase
MRCRAVLTRIDAMRTGELHRSEVKAVREHVGRCTSCEESVDDLEQLATSVKSLGAAPLRSRRDAILAKIADHFDVIEIDGQTLFVAFGEHGIRMIHTGVSEEQFRAIYAERIGRELQRGRLTDSLRRQVVAAIAGKGVAKPAVDLCESGEFERSVLEVLTHIPRGEVRTYAWVAKQAGRPKAIRAVGNICARNVVPFIVPCHRVVPTSGGVGQYAFGSSAKRALLLREGVPVGDLEELAKRGVRFIGSRTTKIFCCPTCKDARRIREENRVAFRDEGEADAKGFRPCKRCQPAAA